MKDVCWHLNQQRINQQVLSRLQFAHKIQILHAICGLIGETSLTVVCLCKGMVMDQSSSNSSLCIMDSHILFLVKSKCFIGMTTQYKLRDLVQQAG